MSKPIVRLISVVFSVVLLTSHTLSAKEPDAFTSLELETASRIAKTVIQQNEAYALVESLTTEVGPRMAGSPGDALAVKWAIEKFNTIGFDKVWTEPVTFKTWQRGVEQAMITSPFRQPIIITALGNSIATSDAGLKAEIVQFDSLDDLKRAESGEVAGKIVFISKRMARFKDGHGYGEAVLARTSGAVEAAKKGAQAILIRSVGTDSDRMPHTGVMNYSEQVKKIPAAAMSNPDADLLMNMLKRGKPVTLQMNLGSGPGPDYTSYNVIGEITGTKYPDEVVLLGAHLDSWDLGTGAIDDGAGVAIAMSTAKRIKDLVGNPKRTIRVVLFANEEQGLFGAKAYANKYGNTLQKHIVGVESDFGAGKIYKFSSKFKPEALPIARQIQSVLEPFGVVWGNNKATGGPDLIPSRRMGMAVVNLYQDGIDYFDYHHTPNDTLDKIKPESLSQNVAVYVAFTYLMANLEGDVGFFSAPN